MAKQDRPDDHRARRRDREASVVGSLSDMGLADLVQTLEMGRKSGVVHLKARTGTRGTCWLRDGRVIDCELGGAPAGEEAFYRILRWREGGFAIEFGSVEREERIALPTQALLLQGMRRIDDWGRLLEQLPPLDRPLEVDVARLGERLARLPDEVNTLLRMFDGRRTLAQVLEAAPRGDVATAEDVARLVADGILRAAPEGADGTSAEPARATAPSTPSTPGDPGGVDWFAGPVGAPAAAPAPVASWGDALTSPSAPPDGAAWLEPPVAPAPVGFPGDAPRPGPRFSIPVPPPGSLPPPPTIAEILSRYQVGPRLLQPATPADGSFGAPREAMPEPLARTADAAPREPAATPAPSAATEPASVPASIAAPTAAAAAAPVAPEQSPAVAPLSPPVAPERSSPVARLSPPAAVVPGAGGARDPDAGAGERRAPLRPDTAPPAGAPEQPELARRLRGESPRRRDLASAPLHLDPPEAVLRERPPEAPRRSAAPYAALGLVVLAVVVGGTALTRRPVLRSSPGTEAAAPRSDGSSGNVSGDPGGRADEPGDAAAAGSAAAVQAPAPAAERATPPAEVRPPVSPETSARAEAAAPPTAPVALVSPPAPKAAAPAPVATPAAAGARSAASASAPPAPPAPPDPRKLLAAADRKYAAGRYAEAIAGYRRVIALEPTPAAHVALARALYDGHRSAEAMKELDGVLAENPRDAAAWLMRGDIHQGEGRSAEAREAYQRFLELQPHGEQARTVRMILGREER